jgi:serine/threonine protein kinase
MCPSSPLPEPTRAADSPGQPPLAPIVDAHPSQPPAPTPLASTVDASQEVPTGHSRLDPSTTPPADAPTIPGYRITSLIARGGMGRVFAAFDETLQREVAIKTLLPRANARRFVTEAKITARLPHPGIPPVHALGTLADGTPWLAMKLIRGRTLHDLLQSLLQSRDPLLQSRDPLLQSRDPLLQSRDPLLQSRDPLLQSRDRQGAGDRGRFIQIFEQIAQAVGFAHSRGILHRDLKPLNVMVGELGEVQVMDWGLAKDTASRDREGAGDETNAAPLPGGRGSLEQTADETNAAPLPGSRGSLEQTADETNAAPLPGGRGSLEQTAAGTVMGTPGYMAPEQARGEPVDARADVFALGSILAAILTGQPAFVGTTVYETIAKAAAADLADVQQRLAACGADAELLAIARRCLAAQPDDRFADGRAVAAAVAAYRATVEARLRQAETAAAEALVREAEQRKRRRLAVGLGSGIAAVLLVGLAVSLGLMQRAIHAERIAVENEQQALANAEQERLAKVEAEAEKRKAIKFRNQALDALRATTGTDVEKLLGAKKELSVNERQYLEAIAGRWQTFARREGTDEASRAVAAEGHYRVAYLWQRLGRREEALREKPEYYRTERSGAAGSAAEKLALPTSPPSPTTQHRPKLARSEEQYKGLALEENLAGLPPPSPIPPRWPKAGGSRSWGRLPGLARPSSDYRRDLATSHTNLGVLLKDRQPCGRSWRPGWPCKRSWLPTSPPSPTTAATWP